MKAFKFRFEALENFRKRQEDEALKLLTVERTRYYEEVRKRENIVKAMHLALERRERLATEPKVSSAQLQIEDDFIEGSKIRIVQADHAIEIARKRMERMLINYLHAHKKKKMVEKIRENDHRKFNEQLRRRELREMDDLYVMRARITKESA